MIKKTFLIFALFTTTTGLAFAETKSYIGAGLGVTDLGYTQNGGGKLESGAIGKLFAGHGYTLGEKYKIYLGGELNLDLASYPNSRTYSNMNYAVGGSFVPGIMLTQTTMLYGRLGMQANKFHNSGQSIQFGSQLGLGLQTKLSKKWDVRAEYIRLSNVASTHDSQAVVGLVYKFD